MCASTSCSIFFNFYPRPPRGGRPARYSRPVPARWISIHVPRVGDDSIQFVMSIGPVKFLSPAPAGGTTLLRRRLLLKIAGFLSTSPAWGTTDVQDGLLRIWRISIHVPRVGDDPIQPTSALNPEDFYPRPPRGGRRRSASHRSSVQKFLSTSPAWGTTRGWQRATVLLSISIHVPRVGDDLGSLRPSCIRMISIHVPRVGDDSSTPRAS